MITAGIDMGAKNIKVVIFKDAEIIGKSNVVTGFDQVESAGKGFEAALKDAGVEASSIGHITATGAGRKAAPGANSVITEVGADAKGAIFRMGDVRTVIDVGAEEGRGIKIDEKGKVMDFAVNEKCAAGAGSFAESMSRALEVTLAEFGEMSLKSDKNIPMNAQCTVFAESEVVSLLHARTPKEDVARAVCDAIASRIAAMVRRVGIEKNVALIGGVSYNVGFVTSLKRTLDCDLIIPQEPEYIGALGAAVIAVERINDGGK